MMPPPDAQKAADKSNRGSDRYELQDIVKGKVHGNCFRVESIKKNPGAAPGLEWQHFSPKARGSGFFLLGPRSIGQAAIRRIFFVPSLEGEFFLQIFLAIDAGLGKGHDP